MFAKLRRRLSVLTAPLGGPHPWLISDEYWLTIPLDPARRSTRSRDGVRSRLSAIVDNESQRR
jgi:hypothetical protein